MPRWDNSPTRFPDPESPQPRALAVGDEEAVTKAGVKFMVDFHCRWCPPLVVARNDIENGVIGEIVSAYLRLNNTLYVPLKMLSWSGKSSILWFLGSHTIDALRFLLRDEVVRVYSVSRSGVLRGRLFPGAITRRVCRVRVTMPACGLPSYAAVTPSDEVAA